MAPGFFDKLKAFASKVGSGIKKAFSWMKDNSPKVLKVTRKAIKLAGNVLGKDWSKASDKAELVSGIIIPVITGDWSCVKII